MARFHHGKHPALQLALSSILFGIGAVFVIFIHLDAVVIAFYRLFLGALLFAAVLGFRRQPLAIDPRALGFASLAGIFFGADLALWNQSIVLIGPGVATILNSLQVFFMAGFGIAFFRDKPTSALWWSLIISFFGVVLLSLREIDASETGGLGIGVGIASGLAFALSMLALRQTAKHQKHSVINTMFYSSVAGAIATGSCALWLGRSFVTDDATSWLLMLLYGAGVHVFAWLLMATSMPLLGVAIVGLIFCLEPVVAVFVDVAFVGKHLSGWQTVGAVLTMSAIYVGTQSKQSRP